MRSAAVACSLFMMLIVAIASVARADTIYLKNGDVIEGVVVAENDDEVTVQIGRSGKMTFRRDRIERIERDDKTGERHERERSGVSGRKREDPPDKPKESPKKPPGEAPGPKVPAKDNPYVDATPVNPAVEEQARIHIRRLSARPRFRNRGRNHLRTMGLAAGRPLTRALLDPNPATRRESAALLGEIGYKPAVPVLIKKSLRDQDSGVRGRAFDALRKLTGQKIRYFPDALPRVREEGLEKWDKWWAREAKRYGMETKKPPVPGGQRPR